MARAGEAEKPEIHMRKRASSSAARSSTGLRVDQTLRNTRRDWSACAISLGLSGFKEGLGMKRATKTKKAGVRQVLNPFDTDLECIIYRTESMRAIYNNAWNRIRELRAESLEKGQWFDLTQRPNR